LCNRSSPSEGRSERCDHLFIHHTQQPVAHQVPAVPGDELTGVHKVSAVHRCERLIIPKIVVPQTPKGKQPC
ncbi:MAG: hypothetical protein V3R94_10830, partial [Acidobacteriota bacterium]